MTNGYDVPRDKAKLPWIFVQSSWQNGGRSYGRLQMKFDYGWLVASESEQSCNSIRAIATIFRWIDLGVISEINLRWIIVDTFVDIETLSLVQAVSNHLNDYSLEILRVDTK